jgi:hypothetical protein
MAAHASRALSLIAVIVRVTMGFLTLLFSAKSFTSKLFDSGGQCSPLFPPSPFPSLPSLSTIRPLSCHSSSKFSCLSRLLFRFSCTSFHFICLPPVLTLPSDACSGECNDNNDNKYWNADGNTDPQLSRSFVSS